MVCIIKRIEAGQNKNKSKQDKTKQNKTQEKTKQRTKQNKGKNMDIINNETSASESFSINDPKTGDTLLPGASYVVQAVHDFLLEAPVVCEYSWDNYAKIKRIPYCTFFVALRQYGEYVEHQLKL